MTRLSPTAALVAGCAALAACRPVAPPDSRMVSEWMHAFYGVVRAERVSPPVAARFMGYASVALYEGLASADPALPSLAGVLNGLPALPSGEAGARYDGTLVAVGAERVIVDSMLAEALPSTRASLLGLMDSLTAAREALGTKPAEAARSADLGRRLGSAILAWSRTDGYDSTRGRPYTPPVGPGLWVNDAPGNTYAPQSLSGATDFIAFDNPANTLRTASAGDRALIVNRPKRAGLTDLPPVNIVGMTEPYWYRIRPFVLSTWDECPITPPPAYATDTASAIYRNAWEVYHTRQALTPEQRATALYWADNPGESGTPVGHWVAIAAQMISQRNLTAGEAARIFVMTAASQADAFVAAWGYKYRYNLLRPRTYIRRVIDPSWEPLIPTPPFPEYPSAHSTQSAAAAAVLTELVGTVPFDDSTGLALGPAVRRFDRFMDAAYQAGESRIFGGIHFPAGNLAGREVGTCIGARVIERLRAASRP